MILTPNPEIIVAAQSDPALMKALQAADLSIPDGVGVVWALRLLRPQRKKVKGKRQKGIRLLPSSFSRLSGIDLMESLLLQPQKVAPYELRPLKVMLLGGRPGIAAKAAEKIASRLRLRNSYRQAPAATALRYQPRHLNRLTILPLTGPQNISTISKSENDRLIAQINSFSPDLLFVAFGHGKQEKWLIDNRERLTAGVAMAVGGAFDQIADPSLRPPPYINSIGLGWLYRLIRQPWRWRRQLALIKFAGMVFRKKLQFSSSKLQFPFGA